MPLTVVVAPDSFKGSLHARAAAEAIATGWLSARPRDTLRLMPQADGGEGTLDAIAASVEGSVLRSAGHVTGPDGRPTPGRWLELPGGVAVAELAQSSGLPLMAALDPLRATTRGLGEVIRCALEAGATSVIIGLGGSASTDAGAGALSALGLRLLDAAGAPINDGGGALVGLGSIDRSGLVAAPIGGVLLLTDVAAPLLGPTGAAAIFAPQKGAGPAQVRQLEEAVGHFAALLGGDPGQAGGGAAGGTAFGFAAAWDARLVSGADYLARLTGLDTALARADVLLTGEGRVDASSFGGKVVGRLLERAALAGLRAGVIAGEVSIELDAWSVSLAELAGSGDASIAEPERWLRAAGAEAARTLLP